MNVIIIGGGQVGSFLGSFLTKHGHSIKIIDNRPATQEKLAEEFLPEQIIRADGSNPEVLIRAGIHKADVCVTVTGQDDINLVVSSLAKLEFGVPKVIARVNNPKNDWLFRADMGVDDTINQAEILSGIILSEMNTKDMMKLLRLNHGQNEILHLSVTPESAVHKKGVSDILLPEKTVLVAVIRNSETILPDKSFRFQPGDEVIVFTDEVHTEAVNRLFS